MYKYYRFIVSLNIPLTAIHKKSRVLKNKDGRMTSGHVIGSYIYIITMVLKAVYCEGKHQSRVRVLSQRTSYRSHGQPSRCYKRDLLFSRRNRRRTHFRLRDGRRCAAYRLLPEQGVHYRPTPDSTNSERFARP